MSIEAMNWVLTQAPDLPASLQPVLMGLASHAHGDGTHAYPSQDRLAFYARKSERQIRRDLEQLEELGLIERGDQRVVAHIDPRHRPIVWNLAMWLVREVPSRFLPRYAQRVVPEALTAPDRSVEESIVRSREDVDVPPEQAVQGNPDIQGGHGGHSGGTSRAVRGDTHVPLTIREPSVKPLKEKPARQPVGQLTGGDHSDTAQAGWLDESRKILRSASTGLGTRTPTGGITNQLVTETCAALARGWTPTAVETALRSSLSGVTDVGRVWLARLSRDLAGAPTAVPFGFAQPGDSEGAVDPELAQVRAASLARREAQIARMLERRQEAAKFGHGVAETIVEPTTLKLPWMTQHPGE